MKEIDIKNKKISLIGGAGFIGHNLAIHLKNKGADVSIIDSLEVNNLTSVIGNADNLPFPELSLSIIQSRLKLLKDKYRSLTKGGKMIACFCLITLTVIILDWIL